LEIPDKSEERPMTPAERERAAVYLAETRERLLRMAHGLSPAQLQFKPGPDRWSVAECLEHIVVVETGVLRLIEGALQKPASSFKSSAELDARLQRAPDRTVRVKAPDILVPTGRWPHDQLLREFETARKGTAEFAATTNAELRLHTFPHPLLGELDCYQWLLLIAAHGERHRAQAEEVMADAGFPRAAAAV
jgi:uncharacterized damage-inducible protein DinB